MQGRIRYMASPCFVNKYRVWLLWLRGCVEGDGGGEVVDSMVCLICISHTTFNTHIMSPGSIGNCVAKHMN